MQVILVLPGPLPNLPCSINVKTLHTLNSLIPHHKPREVETNISFHTMLKCVCTHMCTFIQTCMYVYAHSFTGYMCILSSPPQSSHIPCTYLSISIHTYMYTHICMHTPLLLLSSRETVMAPRDWRRFRRKVTPSSSEGTSMTS